MGVFVALELDEIFDELFPICRSITGDGLRKSLAICGQYIPLTIESTPSGKEVFDWVVPPEWNITSALLTDPDGKVVADFPNTTCGSSTTRRPWRRSCRWMS